MDLKWFPDFLRKIQTNILQVIMTRTKAFDHVIPFLNNVLKKTKENKIIDLCSGASGPWLRLFKKINNEKLEIRLSDKYPNLHMFKKIKEFLTGLKNKKKEQ